MAMASRPAYDAGLTQSVTDWLRTNRPDLGRALAEAHAKGEHHSICAVLPDHEATGPGWARAWISSVAFARTRIALDCQVAGFLLIDCAKVGEAFR